MIIEPEMGALEPAPVRLRTDYGHHRPSDWKCTHDDYGLTCDEYEAMRDRAADCCEICKLHGRDTPRGELVIDHFQSRDAWFVRGLLCDRCNALMQRHDGRAQWGPKTQPHEAAARAYHLNAFGEPSDEERTRADASIARRKRWLRSMRAC